MQSICIFHDDDVILIFLYTQSKSECRDGCVIQIDTLEQTPLRENSLPAPVFPLQLAEASMALGRDPGIYSIDYNLDAHKNVGSTTNNLTTFIFRVQTATSSHFYFKVSGIHLSCVCVRPNQPDLNDRLDGNYHL